MITITVARKPLEGSVAQNVAVHGTGAINVDACKIGDDVRLQHPHRGPGFGTWAANGQGGWGPIAHPRTVVGRFPANFLNLGDDPEIPIEYFWTPDTDTPSE